MGGRRDIDVQVFFGVVVRQNFVELAAFPSHCMISDRPSPLRVCFAASRPGLLWADPRRRRVRGDFSSSLSVILIPGPHSGRARRVSPAGPRRRRTQCGVGRAGGRRPGAAGRSGSGLGGTGGFLRRRPGGICERFRGQYLLSRLGRAGRCPTAGQGFARRPQLASACVCKDFLPFFTNRSLIAS